MSVSQEAEEQRAAEERRREEEERQRRQGEEEEQAEQARLAAAEKLRREEQEERRSRVAASMSLTHNSGQKVRTCSNRQKVRMSHSQLSTHTHTLFRAINNKLEAIIALRTVIKQKGN